MVCSVADGRFDRVNQHLYPESRVNVFFVRLGMNELWEYPFRAGVWGTASDVLMVLVTAATLGYLIKTLKSQRDVQRLQLKVTRIENERFIREQKLKFDVQTDFTTNYTADPVTTQ